MLYLSDILCYIIYCYILISSFSFVLTPTYVQVTNAYLYRIFTTRIYTM